MKTTVTEKMRKLASIAIPASKNYNEWLDQTIDELESLSLAQEIAMAVHHHLDKNGMSQKDLAILMGVTPQNISKILSGKEDLKTSTILKLEKALGLKLIQVMTTGIEKTNVDYFIPSNIDYKPSQMGKVISIGNTQLPYQNMPTRDCIHKNMIKYG